MLGSGFTEDTGTVDYRYTWHLPKDRTWTYDGQLNMVRNEGNWEVRWTATGLHPKLGEHQSLELRGEPPERASVNELGGTDVLRPGNLYRYGLDAKAAGADLMPTARAVVAALHPFDDTLDPQRLAEQASASARPDGPDHAAQGRQRPGGAGDRAPARRGRHAAWPTCCPPTTPSPRPSSAR